MLVLLALLAPGAAAQEAATPEVRYDSSAVVVRAPGLDALQPYRADAYFLYEREPPQSFSLWDRINQWLDKHIFGPLDNVTPDWVWEWFFYLLAAAGIAFAIVRLLRMDLGGVFYGKRDQARLAFETVADDLHETDFDALIDEAVAARHYRRAVRLLYLKTLKALATRHLIDWQRDKTNHEYPDELPTPALRRPFAALTTSSPSVWFTWYAVHTRSASLDASCDCPVYTLALCPARSSAASGVPSSVRTFPSPEPHATVWNPPNAAPS